MYDLRHIAKKKVSLAQSIDTSEWTPGLIEYRKQAARNFAYDNYIPVFGWNDKYEYIRNLANTRPNDLVLRYALYKDPKLETRTDLSSEALMYTGLLHYNKLGLDTTLASLMDTLYAYFMSGQMAIDLDLGKFENYVMGMVIANNLFCSKLGYGRIDDLQYGHISKEYGYVVSSGCKFQDETIRKPLASLIKKGYVVRLSDKQANTAYRYKGMTDLLAILPLDKVMAFKESYKEATATKDTLTPSMKSALSRAMMMHTNSLADTVTQLRVLHYVFYNIVHLGNTETPLNKCMVARVNKLSIRGAQYAYKQLQEKGLLIPVNGNNVTQQDKKLYDIPIFPFDFKKGDIENFLYDHITEIMKYGDNIAEASSVMIKARDGNHTAVYNSIRNLTKSGSEDQDMVIELDVQVPMSIFKKEEVQFPVTAFESYFNALTKKNDMQNIRRSSNPNPTNLFKTFTRYSLGIKRKNTTISYSPLTCQTLGLHPERSLANLKVAIKQGSIPLPSNSVVRLLLGVHDLLTTEYCDGKPRSVKGFKASHRIKVGSGVSPTTTMCGLLARKPQIYKKQILNYTHQYPTVVRTNYRLTDIDRVFGFVMNKIKEKFIKTPPKAPPVGNKVEYGSYGYDTPADSLADLIMCFLSIETKFLDEVGDNERRLPIDRILKEGACAFTKGWYVLPKFDEIESVRQEVEDIHDLLLVLANIKCESIQAQKLTGFIDRNGEYNDEEFFVRFGAADQAINNHIPLSNLLAMTMELPVKTTMTMFEKGAMVRSYTYNNDTELRASYAFNALFNSANYQTFGSLKHNLNKYFNGHYKFISTCKLESVLDTVKRGIGMRLDKLIDTEFDMMQLVDFSDFNRRIYKHYGANLFQTGVKQKISRVFDDTLADLNGLSKYLKTIDETFETLKTVETGFVATKMVKHWTTKKFIFQGCPFNVTTTERGIDYGVPSNLMAVFVSSARFQTVQNGQVVVSYGKVDKNLVQRLSQRYERDLDGVASDAQKYIDNLLQFEMSGGILESKYNHTYLWEMPHVIEKRFEYKPFTNTTYWKESSTEEERGNFDGRQWYLESARTDFRTEAEQEEDLRKLYEEWDECARKKEAERQEWYERLQASRSTTV